MAYNLKDTSVILVVNIGEILNYCKYPIPDNKLKEWVDFFDDRGDPPGNGNNFNSKIDKSKKIIWRGFPKDSENHADTVEILSIKKIGGSSLLKKDKYNDLNGKGVVVGHVKNQDDLTGIEIYEITFTINKDTEKPYTIDPKMHM